MFIRIKNKDEKDILRREILDLHFNNFQNCYSRKNEWLLVKYMERKINEFILSLNKKYDDSEEYDNDFSLDNEIEKKMNNFSDKDIKSLKDKVILFLEKLKINWNFTFIEYNIFLIYITLKEITEINNEIYTDYFHLLKNDINSLKIMNINIPHLLCTFINEYKKRDFFYLLRKFIVKYKIEEIENTKHTFIWLSTANKGRIKIEPEKEIEFEKIKFQKDNIFKSDLEQKSNSEFFYPICSQKGIVYEGISHQIQSFIFKNYSKKEEENYFNDFNYIYNHISIFD